MAVCKGCGATVNYFSIVAGVCKSCLENPDQQVLLKTTAATVADEVLPEIPMTTEASWPVDGWDRIGIIGSSCVYGQHVGKDIATAWRDVLGGRAASVEKTIDDARSEVLLGLQRKAADLRADAVIAITFDHSQTTGGSGGMVMVNATGTALRRRA